jgi:hypothetical protein
MTRTLNNFEEVGYLADNDKRLLTQVTSETAISVTRNHEAKVYVATISVKSARTGNTICRSERAFSTMESLMELLGIDDVDEVWEVLE